MSLKTPKPELLAPAGDEECLEAAINFGADAVYLGGRLLQLRASRAAFDDERLEKAVSFAHSKGKKVYVTVNSFAFNDEIAECADYARFLRDVGADAAIISDIGVLSAFREAAPELEAHVSTQANTMNYAAAMVYRSMGAKRIVLARELSLDEIKKL
ncbi:MAG: U32 family peptidase, partial [Oscillospiraceae bacterium]|nr:U32 family peptidase [Oscillospiraceae bacterium]